MMRRDVSFLSQLSPNGDPRRAHQQTAELGEVQFGNQRQWSHSSIFLTRGIGRLSLWMLKKGQLCLQPRISQQRWTYEQALEARTGYLERNFDSNTNTISRSMRY
jgi:hypothetical protein